MRRHRDGRDSGKSVPATLHRPRGRRRKRLGDGQKVQPFLNSLAGMMQHEYNFSTNRFWGG
jgi:hypothetical protein